MKPDRWEIRRIELAFYNSGDNRWQLFGKKPSLDGAAAGDTQTADDGPRKFYRTQIEALLDTVWDAFQRKAGNQDSRISVVPLDHPAAEKLKVKFGDNPSFAKNVADYCTNALIREGRGSLYDAQLAELGKCEERQLHPKAALDILSVFPIKSDWDVFGRLGKWSVNEAPVGSVAIDPDNYEKVIYYNITLGEEIIDPARRNKYTLKYPVDLRLYGTKESKDLLEPCNVGFDPIDYYAFAKPVPPGSEDHELYTCYSNLIDTIQKRLYGDTNDIYIVAFPVRACGYRHFLQLYVKPVWDTGGPHTGLEVIRDFVECFSLGNFLPRDEYAIFKECLRELLVQIRLSAFQHHVTEWVIDHFKGVVREPFEDIAAKCFCELAHHINEMRWIRYGDRWWGHSNPARTSECQITKSLNPWVEVSAPSPEQLPLETVLKKANDKLERKQLSVYLFPVEPANFRHKMFVGTNVRRLEEQLEMVWERLQRFRQAFGG